MNKTIKFPVYIGDTVYAYSNVFHVVLPYEVYYIEHRPNITTYNAVCTDDEGGIIDEICFTKGAIGQTIFISEWEAFEDAKHKEI